MTDTDLLHRPRLGRPGETCRSCAAPLAGDQRYCLNCGVRRNDTPLRFLEEPGTAAAVGGADGPPDHPGMRRLSAAVPPPVPAPVSSGEQRPVTLIAAVATMLLALGVGVVIGNAGDGGAAKPTVITVGGVAAPQAAAAAAPATFTSDWPAGKEGWTIQLSVLPKASTTPEQVAAAKTDATGKGVAAVGALDSDAYASLPAGSYVVYSGVYDAKKDAEAALAAVTANAPGAQVVQISSTAEKTDAPAADDTSKDPSASDDAAKDPDATSLDDALKKTENATPDAFQKESKKLPDTIQSEGPPPAKDSKPAGGGSDAETFG